MYWSLYGRKESIFQTEVLLGRTPVWEANAVFGHS